MSAPDLTVVLATATPPSPAAIAASVRALADGCTGVATELIIVGDGPDRALESAVAAAESAGTTRVRILRCDSALLAPERWGAGARVAEGRVVAFTTDHLRVGAGWGRALVDAVDGGAAGVGGPIALDPRADAATAAAHLIRFSAFLPGAFEARRRVRDVAGDNAAYSRAAIARHDDLLREGFWEVEFHRRFETDGLTLEMIPEAPATLVGPIPTGALARQRYVHAREFGATRVHRHHESRWRIVLAAPLVPFVLLARMRRRARSDATTARRFTGLLPRLGWLACAWAAGEAAGALSSHPAAR